MQDSSKDPSKDLSKDPKCDGIFVSWSQLTCRRPSVVLVELLSDLYVESDPDDPTDWSNSEFILTTMMDRLQKLTNINMEGQYEQAMFYLYSAICPSLMSNTSHAGNIARYHAETIEMLRFERGQFQELEQSADSINYISGKMLLVWSNHVRLRVTSSTLNDAGLVHASNTADAYKALRAHSDKYGVGFGDPWLLRRTSALSGGDDSDRPRVMEIFTVTFTCHTAQQTSGAPTPGASSVFVQPATVKHRHARIMHIAGYGWFVGTWINMPVPENVLAPELDHEPAKISKKSFWKHLHDVNDRLHGAQDCAGTQQEFTDYMALVMDSLKPAFDKWSTQDVFKLPPLERFCCIMDALTYVTSVFNLEWSCMVDVE
jgi:hypothetical protein